MNFWFFLYVRICTTAHTDGHSNVKFFFSYLIINAVHEITGMFELRGRWFKV